LKILVTGGAGYVGSVLIPKLIDEGHEVTCLDRFFFGKEFFLGEQLKNKVTLIQDDIRWVSPDLIKNFDVVIDLAAISNDPAGEFDPVRTLEINYLGRSRIARISKLQGIKRYILASTASVYGFQNEIVNEESKVNPLTTYAKAARLAEQDILPISDKDFSVTVVRFGTLFGSSPRMRFDLGINAMTHSIFKDNKIFIDGDGNQERAVLHVKDAARVYSMIINAPLEKIQAQIFNSGSDHLRYNMNQVANEIRNSINEKIPIEHRGSVDNRSYTASFKKIKQILDFEPKYNIAYGAKEVYNDLKNGKIVRDKKTITLEWYKHIFESEKDKKELSVNDRFF